MKTLALSSFGPIFTLRARDFKKAFSVMQERRELARLTDAQLADIGIDRATAMQEAARPIWDVPCR